MCKICRRNRNIEQTYTYIVHHQQVTSNTANSQTGLPCTAKVTDIPVNTHANNSPVNRICFALNNSTSSRRKASFKLAYIFRQYATSEPRARLSTLCRFTRRHTCAGNHATGLQVAKGAVIECARQLLSTSEDDRPALNRVRTQFPLPIYSWSWR